MKEMIEQYVKAQEHSWSDTTRRSERYRLNALVPVLTGRPEDLWTHLEQNSGAYSRVTAWTRVVSLYDWMLESGFRSGTNPYRIWRKRNARLFKHCYQRRLPSIGFEEACRRIEAIEDRAVREACFSLLRRGLRISELDTFDPGTNTVLGKGGKRRRVYGEVSQHRRPDAKLGSGFIARLRGCLALSGLKPHDLRKIAATEFRRRGLKEEDLLKVMGWTSMETAKSYLAPMKDEELEEKLA
jgi:hypothetical protein